MRRLNTIMPVFTLLTVALQFEAVAAGLALHGVVIDAGSSRRVSGAVVSATGGLGRCDVATDDDGTFVLPLIQAVQPGQLLRIRVDVEGYKSADIQVPASSDALTTVRLKRHASPPSLPVIERVSFLDGYGGAKTLEIQVFNNAKTPAFFNRIQVSGEYVLSTAGVTGFLSRADYDISIQATADGKIVGNAQPSGLLGPGYAVQGYFRSVFADFEQSWRGGFSTTCPIRIDPTDKLLIRLNLRNPQKTLRDTQKDGEAMMYSVLAVRTKVFSVRLINDAGSVIAWKGQDPRPFLDWLQRSDKELPR